MNPPTAVYIPVQISQFLCGEFPPVDLYFKLSDQKYLKIFKAGGYLNKDRLRNYENKKLETLHVLEQEFPLYVEGCLTILKTLVQGNKPGVEQDFSLSFRVAESVFICLGITGLKDSSMGQMVELADILSNQIKLKPKLGDFTDQLFAMDNVISRHAVATTSVALMILHGLRWKLQKNVEAIVLAALLHDISLLKFPEVYSLSVDEWSPETKKAFEDHPFQGAQLLLDSGVLQDKRVADIIRNHHELPSGTGFPKGLKGNQILSMALPVIMADRLVQLLLDPSGPLVENTLPRAIRYLKNREQGFYPESYWKALGDWES